MFIWRRRQALWRHHCAISWINVILQDWFCASTAHSFYSKLYWTRKSWFAYDINNNVTIMSPSNYTSCLQQGENCKQYPCWIYSIKGVGASATKHHTVILSVAGLWMMTAEGGRYSRGHVHTLRLSILRHGSAHQTASRDQCSSTLTLFRAGLWKVRFWAGGLSPPFISKKKTHIGAANGKRHLMCR